MRSEILNINIDDSVLVEQCQSGSTAAMERLIIKYQDRIYNVILKICANEDDAAELAQDTFVKVIEKISGFESRSGFYTWAFRIAVNLTLNYCKKKVKLNFGPLDEGGESGSAKVRLKEYLADESSPDPVAIAQNREISALLERAIARLEESHRAVLVLRDVEGMNYEQIADVLDIELGTVKSRLSRARNNLREMLETVLNERT